MKYLSLVIIAGLAVAAIWVVTTFTFPAFQEALSQFQQWNALRSENAELAAIQAEVKKIPLGDIQKNAAQFDYDLPKDYRSEELILLLQGFVKGSGVQVSDIKFTQIPAATSSISFVTPVSQVRIDLKASGTYSQMHQLLSYLETSARVFDVKFMEFSSEKGQLSSGFTIYTYHLQ